MKRIIHTTEARSAKIAEPLTFAVAPDIHSGQYADVLEAMLGCDAVLLPGDLMDRHRRNNSRAAEFLRTVPEIVPVFLSPGNHEALYPRQDELAGMLRHSAVRLAFLTGLRRRTVSACCCAISRRFTGIM